MLIDDVEILAVLNQPVRIENLADDASGWNAIIRRCL